MVDDRPNRDGDRAARPSPDALLAQAAQEGRGRLKVFLGAAPGVGKTFEMLATAQARRRDGVDVVVGVVETHGRPETQALLDGLEAIPRRAMEYRGHRLEEMDLDAVLARRPALVLVDELAHTNAPGSRHPKRYMDVQELLAAGIDVYTTLNIQHVESLNDVVQRITRIRVRETVPDGILDEADDIEVVDLAPADLIRRLEEGKVYVPAQAARALRHYFAPGNLTALRELALRRTAQRVDQQLLSHMQAHAIPGPWPAGERVLVCVSEAPGIAGVVRHARRVADRLHAPWTALHVETARTHRLDEAARDRIAEALRLAERLGAEAMTIPGRTVVEEILAYARAHNVTQIVVGKSRRPRWFELLHGSVVHELVRQAGGIVVQVAATREAEADATARPVATRPPQRPAAMLPHVAALAAVAAALGAGLVVQPWLGTASIDLVFLIAIIAVALRYGTWPSLVSAVASSLAYNFFFIPPLYTFTIADPSNVAALLFFLAVSALVSNLAARVRSQAVTARSRAATAEALYAFSRKLAGVATLDDLLWAAAHQIASMLKLDVVLLLPEDAAAGGKAAEERDRRLAVAGAYPPEDRLDEADLAAARWAWENNRPAGRGADTLHGARRLFVPLRTGQGAIGVVGIDRDRPGLLLADERRLLDALLDQIAVAVERVRFAGEIKEARLLAETERLRTALLTSLSHDLRTPLASIIGAATSLQQYDGLYDAAARRGLAATIQEEAERLSRFVRNLLDMTRLESGALDLDSGAVDLGEVVGTALGRTARTLDGHAVSVDIPADLPMLKADPVLFEQVLVNLLDNAAKYAPAGTAVAIAGRVSPGGVAVEVRDEGPGIPPDATERIFEKFYRAAGGDRQRAGTGLGLSVCRGFVEAMGGTIHAGNRTDRAGAVFTVEMPATPALCAAEARP